MNAAASGGSGSGARPRARGYASRSMRTAIRTLVAACLLLPPADGLAASALRLPVPGHFGAVPAETFDGEGDRVGGATLEIRRLDDGHVLMSVETGIEGAERSRAEAELRPAPEGGALELVRQRSRSVDASQNPLGVLEIDHLAKRGSCTPAGDGEPQVIELPDPDRVANVPLNLLFLPLVRGEKKTVDFQILLCRGGPRLVDATAEVASVATAPGQPGHRMVEVRYKLDFGPFLSRLAAPFMPRLSFWFDRDAAGEWLAHTQPLFAKGPTVLVVRSGIPLPPLEGGL